MAFKRDARTSPRASLPRRKLSRAPCVVMELVAGRYYPYSRGVLSAAKDLVSEVVR